MCVKLLASGWSLHCGPATYQFSSFPSRSEPPSLQAAKALASLWDWLAQVQLEAWLWQASNGM